MIYRHILFASAPIQAPLKFVTPILCTISFLNRWLISHLIIVERANSCEEGIDTVLFAFIHEQLLTRSHTMAPFDTSRKVGF